jgi:hypothetical protein
VRDAIRRSLTFTAAATLEATVVKGGWSGGDSGALAGRVAAWEAGAGRREARLAELSGLRWPDVRYGDFAEACSLVLFSREGHRHARQAERARLQRAARRYDRWVGVLLAAGDPVPPTAMAGLIDELRRAVDDPTTPSVISVGYFARRLDRLSKRVRLRARGISPESMDREVRRRRRIARYAAELERPGIHFRRDAEHEAARELRRQALGPGAVAHRVDDVGGHDVVEVALGGPQVGVPEGAHDDHQRDALQAHLRGEGVA